MDVNKWDEWNQSGGPRYPHNKVIQFALREFGTERERVLRALDLGCGGGVNSLFLAREGFSVTCTDISEVAIEKTTSILRENNFEAEGLQVCASHEIAFSEEFDFVCCIGVFECLDLDKAKKTTSRVLESLKAGGVAIFVFSADDNWRIRDCENPLGLNGYRLEEVENIFSVGFSEVNIDEYITTFLNRKFKSREWLVTVRK